MCIYARFARASASPAAAAARGSASGLGERVSAQAPSRSVPRGDSGCAPRLPRNTRTKQTAPRAPRREPRVLLVSSCVVAQPDGTTRGARLELPVYNKRLSLTALRARAALKRCAGESTGGAVLFLAASALGALAALAAIAQGHSSQRRQKLPTSGERKRACKGDASLSLSKHIFKKIGMLSARSLPWRSCTRRRASLVAQVPQKEAQKKQLDFGEIAVATQYYEPLALGQQFLLTFAGQGEVSILEFHS